MRYPDFGKVAALGFVFVSRGHWRHAAKQLSIVINEDYGRTFQAYRSDYRRPFTNAAGHPIRFRSPEAACAYALKHSE